MENRHWSISVLNAEFDLLRTFGTRVPAVPFPDPSSPFYDLLGRVPISAKLPSLPTPPLEAPDISITISEDPKIILTTEDFLAVLDYLYSWPPDARPLSAGDVEHLRRVQPALFSRYVVELAKVGKIRKVLGIAARVSDMNSLRPPSTDAGVSWLNNKDLAVLSVSADADAGKSNDNVKRFPCETCGHSFARRYNLKSATFFFFSPSLLLTSICYSSYAYTCWTERVYVRLS
jgi:hypothetical protein